MKNAKIMNSLIAVILSGTAASAGGIGDLTKSNKFNGINKSPSVRCYTGTTGGGEFWKGVGVVNKGTKTIQPGQKFVIRASGYSETVTLPYWLKPGKTMKFNGIFGGKYITGKCKIRYALTSKKISKSK